MSTLPDIGRAPNYGLTAVGSFTRDITSFGDGYELRRPNGMQPYRRGWDVRWSSISKSQRDTLRDFLVAQRGVYAFSWQLPGESEVLSVVCPAPPVVSYDSYNLYTLTATFEENQNL